MRRLFGAISIAAIFACATVTGAVAAPPFPHTIVLPGATSAEGIATAGGPTFYAGDAFAGDIYRGNLATGAVSRFIDAPAGRNALGIRMDEQDGLLFVAGGFTGQAYVYNLATGADIATFQFGTPPNSIINDVIVAGGAACVTDSVVPHIYRVPIVGPGSVGAFDPHGQRPSGRSDRRVQPQWDPSEPRRRDPDRRSHRRRSPGHGQSDDRRQCHDHRRERPKRRRDPRRGRSPVGCPELRQSDHRVSAVARPPVGDREEGDRRFRVRDPDDGRPLGRPAGRCQCEVRYWLPADGADLRRGGGQPLSDLGQTRCVPWRCTPSHCRGRMVPKRSP